MKVIFWASPAYAVYSLHELLGAGFEVPAVYTRADKVSGRGKNVSPTPVASAAEKLGLTVRKPDRLKNAGVVDEIRSWGAECFVVVAYGKILPREILDIPPLGCVNVHPSLLPLYRGASPVASAILDDAKITGVTHALLEEEVDSGPILAQSEEVSISEEALQGNLLEQLMKMGAEMLPDTLRRLAEGTLKPVQQNQRLATVTRRFSKSDGLIDWRQDSAYIARMVRAFDPWPGAWTRWGDARLKVLEARALDGEALEGYELGTAFLHKGGLVVTCGTGALNILKVQIADARPMSATEFVNGRPSIVGSRLI